MKGNQHLYSHRIQRDFNRAVFLEFVTKPRADHMEDSDPIEWDDMDMPTFLLFGSLMSVSCDLILYPCELIKVRLQTQGKNSSFVGYTGLGNAFQRVIKEEGARGLYKGFGVTMIGYIPAEFIYYTVYEYTKRTIKQGYKSISAWNPKLPNPHAVEPAIYLFCGGLAECCSASVWIPCDILQAKLMIQGPIAERRSYYGGRDAIRKIWKEDGFKGFYRGALATCLTFSCHSAVNWMVYERCRRTFYNYYIRKKIEITNTRRTLTHMGCGAMSGAIAATVATPFDVIKTRLQVQHYHSKTHSTTSPNSTIRSMYRTILQQHGYAGFMRGVTARILYHTPVTSITLVTYEFIKRFAMKEPAK